MEKSDERYADYENTPNLDKARADIDLGRRGLHGHESKVSKPRCFGCVKDT